MTFEETLINEVRSHPTVWDRQSENYKNQQKSDKAWRMIAKNLNKTKDDVKTQWRYLKEAYLKELTKIPKSGLGDEGKCELKYTGKWPYFSHMTFLEDDFNKPRVTKRRPRELEKDDDSICASDDSDQETYVPKDTWPDKNRQTVFDEINNLLRSDGITESIAQLSGTQSCLSGQSELISHASGKSISAGGLRLNAHWYGEGIKAGGSRGSVLSSGICTGPLKINTNSFGDGTVAGGSETTLKETFANNRKEKRLTESQLKTFKIEEGRTIAYKTMENKTNTKDVLYFKSTD